MVGFGLGARARVLTDVLEISVVMFRIGGGGGGGGGGGQQQL